MLRGIVQHDTLNVVNIRLSDGSKAFDYYGYTNIVLKVLKADGTSYIDSEGENVVATSPEDGIVTVILGGQATAAAGLNQAVIEIYADGDRMTSARLIYEVFEELPVDEAALVSEVDYPVLQNLMLTMENGYVTRAEQAADEAEMWAKASQNIAEGDFATRAELEALRDSVSGDFATRSELEAVRAGAAPAMVQQGTYFATQEEFEANLLETYRAMGLYSAMDVVYTAFSVDFPPNHGTNVYAKFYKSDDDYGTIECVSYNQRYGRFRYRVYAGVMSLEYYDPPMDLGVEYRTTERYMGKPVYAKLLNAGTVTALSTITVPYAENVHHVVFADVYATAADQYNSEGYVYISGARKSGVVLKNAGATDATDCLVHMKYTKTTDT